MSSWLLKEVAKIGLVGFRLPALFLFPLSLYSRRRVPNFQKSTQSVQSTVNKNPFLVSFTKGALPNAPANVDETFAEARFEETFGQERQAG